jgi:hypothetical protein
LLAEVLDLNVGIAGSVEKKRQTNGVHTHAIVPTASNEAAFELVFRPDDERVGEIQQWSDATLELQPL